MEMTDYILSICSVVGVGILGWLLRTVVKLETRFAVFEQLAINRDETLATLIKDHGETKGQVLERLDKGSKLMKHLFRRVKLLEAAEAARKKVEADNGNINGDIG